MSSFLPREWGESGALRVSDVHSRPVAPVKVTREVQEWMREQDTHRVVDLEARRLRALNQERFNASLERRQRPARVS